MADPRQINKCRGSRDGECFWGDCPQIRDDEPNKSGRHCPLDVGCPRCLYALRECQC